jgi:enoyl-CoA hydratase/carnithine racemase
MAVHVEPDGDVLVITLDAPPLNLFDDAMFQGVGAAVERAETARPRAVLLRAEGRVVSGGANVHLFDGLSAAAGSALFAGYLDIARRLHDLPCPTVFAAHGLCLTAAFELALHCDLIVAARSARFGLVERVVGLTPGVGGTQRLAQRAGPGRAREVVMTGELFDAETMERWNVVNRVLDDEGFDEAARTLARGLAAGPPLAHAATKEILAAFEAGGVAAANQVTPRASAGLFDTEDLRGAVRAFLERGPGQATFSGR